MNIYKHKFNLFRKSVLGNNVLIASGSYYTDKKSINEAEEWRVRDYIDNHCVFDMDWADANLLLELEQNPKLLSVNEIVCVMADAPHIKLFKVRSRNS